VLPAHVLHAPPLLPHWLFDVPATQLPPPVQQPPLHGWLAGSHFVVHRCVVVLQAVPDGQSASELQPQKVVAPIVTQADPLLLEAQLTHAGADAVAPHAALELPCEHVPALQHPPLHTAPAAQDVEHSWVVGSHA
jgi:hypothetical protein